MKMILVLGAGGFIGDHLVTKLKAQGHVVRGVDLKLPEFGTSKADDFMIRDLAIERECWEAFALHPEDTWDEVYQLAADMGGAGYIFSGDNDAKIMTNSVLINLNVAVCCRGNRLKLFYSSSACIYPEYNQMDPDNPLCSEESAYPAQPDSEYGWEKLFSERLYLAYARNYGLDVRIARFHNIYGPNGTWEGGREKAPAAMCRKVAETKDGGDIEIWGDGKQTRSFLYIDECLEAVERLMESDFQGPVNIGSEEMVTIDELARAVIVLSGKTLWIKHIDGPLGVRGRSSDNKLIREKLGWAPANRVDNDEVFNSPLMDGMEQTYKWIAERVKLKAQAERV